ncbi:MAG: DUF3122 domain-containing protein, partial [Symploca sp. SIO2B6]|nr:DUF3122 domain-containing protein [Symploca sp. SIO2B6]
RYLWSLLLVGVMVFGAGIVARPDAIALSSRIGLPPFTSHFPATPTIALLDQHQEAPGQILYKSFVTLKDQKQRLWQAIAFNQTLPDGRHNFQLRFVGFPGTVSVDRTQPLQIKTALGQSFTVLDTSDQIFKGATAEPNVAQYNLLDLLGQVSSVIPLRLRLPLAAGQEARFLVSPNTLQEWQSVRNHG